MRRTPTRTARTWAGLLALAPLLAILPASAASAASSPAPTAPTVKAAAAATVPAQVTLAGDVVRYPNSITLSWSAPANGGSALKGYTVQVYRANTLIGTVTTTGTTVTYPGVENALAYSFVISATNAVGTGPASQKFTVVGSSASTVPGAVYGVQSRWDSMITNGKEGLAVKWTAPRAAGEISGYVVTVYLKGAVVATAKVDGAGYTSRVVQLDSHGSKIFSVTVAAVNTRGQGPASQLAQAPFSRS